MKKNLLPSSVDVKDYAGLLSKIWQISLILLFLFPNSFYAQELKSQEPPVSGWIVIAGDAVIYSKDPSFNEQISKSKSIQKYSNVLKIGDNELKIVAKNAETPSKKPKSKAKPEVDLLAAKKLKDSKNIDLPKRKVSLYISNSENDSNFLAGYTSGNGSFVTPCNDYQHSKYFLAHSDYSERCSLAFPYFIDCFYKNDNFKSHLNVASFSVRPPPSGLI